MRYITTSIYGKEGSSYEIKTNTPLREKLEEFSRAMNEMARTFEKLEEIEGECEADDNHSDFSSVMAGLREDINAPAVNRTNKNPNRIMNMQQLPRPDG